MTGPDLFPADSRRAGFADGKEEGALRTIGEVAKALGIRQHVLRYWEEQFPMLKPLKRSGGRRYYRPEDVALVEAIDRLVHREGYTLRGARQALAGGKAARSESTPQVAEPQPLPASSLSASPLSASAPPAQFAPAPIAPAPGPVPTNAFALRARLIALRTTLVKALHDS